VVVSINGTNDAPVLSASTASATEDGSAVSGQMSAADVDANDTLIYTAPRAVDGFTLQDDGSWIFDPSDAAYQHLAAGATQQVTIPVTVTDSAGATDTQNLVITVTGTDDVPVITNTMYDGYGVVMEDSPSKTTATGMLTATDVDSAAASLSWQIVGGGAGVLGTLVVDAQTGQWTYTLDNSDPDTDRLTPVNGAGRELFTVRVSDGHGGTADQQLYIGSIPTKVRNAT
jgi:VCBS repeat-containing protein